jgi:DHA1 family bicyclomycin/chloramphenicol resistance-like MFS transporter
VLHHGPLRVLGWGVRMLAIAAAALLLSALTASGGFLGVLLPIYAVVASLGLIASNAAAIAMAPFGSRAGSAASLFGASQSLVGVLASAAVGWIIATGAIPMAVVVAACAAISLLSYQFLVLPHRNRA